VRIVLTGSSGRVGTAIRRRLAATNDIIGVDRVPASGTQFVGDVADSDLLTAACRGAGAIVHVAALHAPHVGLVPDAEFERVNVGGTRAVVDVALAAGIRRIVFTSTTALYGDAVAPRGCTWVDEETTPRPRTIYHRTKLAAEGVLYDAADTMGLEVRVIRMSRCFPEPAPVMAVYRLHRGVDARDVADAHARALAPGGPRYQCYVVSGATPFRRDDVAALGVDAPNVIRARAPALAAAFDERQWTLPTRVDRVYDSSRACTTLGWLPRYGFEEVLAELDQSRPEVLPP